MYGDQFGEFECGYWGLKGYASLITEAINRWHCLNWIYTLHFVTFS